LSKVLTRSVTIACFSGSSPAVICASECSPFK